MSSMSDSTLNITPDQFREAITFALETCKMKELPTEKGPTGLITQVRGYHTEKELDPTESGVIDMIATTRALHTVAALMSFPATMPQALRELKSRYPALCRILATKIKEFEGANKKSFTTKKETLQSVITNYSPSTKGFLKGTEGYKMKNAVKTSILEILNNSDITTLQGLTAAINTWKSQLATHSTSSRTNGSALVVKRGWGKSGGQKIADAIKTELGIDVTR